MAFVPANLPADFWPRSWQRGDTTLTYFGARNKDELVLAHLRASPELAALLPDSVEQWPRRPSR